MKKQKKKKFCILCGNLLSKTSRGFCFSCYLSNQFSLRTDKNYKIQTFCTLCGEKKSIKSILCLSCSFSNRPRQRQERICILCGSNRSKGGSSFLCRSCFLSNCHSLWKKKERREKENIKFCLLCGEIIRSSKSGRCRSCYLSNQVISLSTRKKISKANKGRMSPNKGKAMPIKQRRKMSRDRKGKYMGKDNPNWKGGTSKAFCCDCGKEVSNYYTKRCLPCQHKQLVRLNLAYKKNKCEIFLDDLLNRLLPKEYKYVGQADFWIEKYNPDFINVNGQKKIIELFGNYWHKKPEYIVRDKKKIQTYKKYGYDCLVIWQHDLKKPKIINRILKFHNRENKHEHRTAK